MNREKVIDILTEELGLVNYIEVSKYLAELETEIIILKEKIDKAKLLITKHSIDCFEKYYDNNDFCEILNIILEILKGDSNE